MLRIDLSSDGNGAATLCIHGRIVEPWDAEIRRACETLIGANREFHLDLSEVSFVDRAGARLLAWLRRRNIRLAGCSPFVEEQLKAVASA
jgi:anti-anti-sigma regulatory factor